MWREFPNTFQIWVTALNIAEVLAISAGYQLPGISWNATNSFHSVLPRNRKLRPLVMVSDFPPLNLYATDIRDLCSRATHGVLLVRPILYFSQMVLAYVELLLSTALTSHLFCPFINEMANRVMIKANHFWMGRINEMSCLARPI